MKAYLSNLSTSLATSESVYPGHADKVADQIADAVLDDILKKDKYARVACEVLVKRLVVRGDIAKQGLD